MDKSLYDISLICFVNTGEFEHNLPSHIHTTFLSKVYKHSNIFIILKLAKLFKVIKPDIICSWLNYATIVTAMSIKLSGIKSKFICSEHSIATKVISSNNYAAIRQKIAKYSYKKANKIIAVSDAAKTDLINNFDIPSDKCIVIHNLFDLNNIKTLSKEPIDIILNVNSFVIITCSRLVKSKNIYLLIDAFCLLNKHNTELWIIGSGPLDIDLKKYAKDKKCERNIRFLGYQSNPYKYMSKASVLVVSSNYESFGNVIIEAMACGIPVISTECYGPSEIIINRQNGLLVPTQDILSMVNAIDIIITNHDIKQKIVSTAYDNLLYFDIHYIIPKYYDVFNSL